MKVPKKLKTAYYAPGFRNSEIYEAASENYRAKLEELQAKYAYLIRPGVVVHANVAHDDDCAALHGGPGCTCDPEVSLEVDGVLYR